MTIKTTLWQSFQKTDKFLGWLFALIMFSLNIYQWYSTRDLENKLKQAEARIASAQDELDKAQGFIEEMESNLKAYEAADVEVNGEIETLIAKWKNDLVKMKQGMSEKRSVMSSIVNH